jgi:hypothetical protein
MIEVFLLEAAGVGELLFCRNPESVHHQGLIPSVRQPSSAYSQPTHDPEHVPTEQKSSGAQTLPHAPQLKLSNSRLAQ